MKLQQGQIWQKGDEYIRLVHLERWGVEYKTMKDPVTKVGTHHKAAKKEFCRLIKGAVLLSATDLAATMGQDEEPSSLES